MNRHGSNLVRSVDPQRDCDGVEDGLNIPTEVELPAF